jgi:hypothetical protein
LDRNLDALINELAEICQRIFSQAAEATSRSAVVSSISPELSTSKRVQEEARSETPAFPFRERTGLKVVLSAFLVFLSIVEMSCV